MKLLVVIRGGDEFPRYNVLEMENKSIVMSEVSSAFVLSKLNEWSADYEE